MVCAHGVAENTVPWGQPTAHYVHPSVPGDNLFEKSFYRFFFNRFKSLHLALRGFRCLPLWWQQIHLILSSNVQGRQDWHGWGIFQEAHWLIKTVFHSKWEQTESSDSYQGKSFCLLLKYLAAQKCRIKPSNLCSWFYKTHFHNYSFLIFHISRLAWPPLNLLFEKYSFKWQSNQQVSGADNKDAIFSWWPTWVWAARPWLHVQELGINLQTVSFH